MRRAGKKDRKLVVDILAKSFRHNKSVNAVVKQDRFIERRIAALMDYSFDVCRLYGEIWIADNDAGCALVLDTRAKQSILHAIFLQFKLAIFAIGVFRIIEVLRRQNRVKQHHPEGDITYLWFIGVAPAYQRQGVGSTLLAHVVNIARTTSRPIYLETSMPENVRWYKSHGFEVFATVDFTYTLYLLKRLV